MNFFTQKLRTLLLAAVLAVGALCLSGCGGDGKPSALVGQWVFVSGDDPPPKGSSGSMELFKDGTGVIEGVSVTWKVENKRLVMFAGNGGNTSNYNVSGYELTITEDDGKSNVFVKKESLEEYKKKKKKEAEQKIEKLSSYFTDSRNGQKYRAIKIGSQTWMAENLNYKPESGNSWYYDDDESMGTKYGMLYDWETAKTICPAGWHLPSREEWGDLVKSTGDKMAGRFLKSEAGWEKDGNGLDGYGFSALPGGFHNFGIGYQGVGYRGEWWTATENSPGSNAFRVRMVFDDDYNDYVSWEFERNGHSVRCVQD
jgi:uncharacterized protein (TIGR02145 family)